MENVSKHTEEFPIGGLMPDVDGSETTLLSEINRLQKVVETLQSENADLELLLENTTQHADFIEMELEKRNTLIRNLFGRYLDNDIVDNLLETPEGLKLGGKRHTITMLVSDLRGFTAFSEQLSAEDVVKVINFYLSQMVEVIATYHGTIDEFMGDGILIFFGAPIEREDDAARAVACAISMQTVMRTINAQMDAWGLPHLSMGIGINTGEVVVGNIGSEKRAKYGVVGKQVNLTFRLESCTTGNQILISESTWQKLQSMIQVNQSKQIRIKGVSEPVTVYDVVGIGGEYNLWLPQDHEDDELLPLDNPILIQCEILDGKEVTDIVLTGRLIKLSGKGATVQFDPTPDQFIPDVYTDLKFSCSGNGDVSAICIDNYAKVIALDSDDRICQIQFTSMFFDSMPNLKQLYQSLKQSLHSVTNHQ
ncbi:MAG: adenylate/guanylate cyclase domain-containing protein [Leptolyngbyaceae cyanobacterium bins.302]|nr:adenylate/guanylate cyclase domain-containing protein [Leptolyngbyaceae cyanobacterium bins.302]